MNKKIKHLVKRCNSPIVITYDHYEKMIYVNMSCIEIQFFDKDDSFITLSANECCKNEKEIYEIIKQDLKKIYELFPEKVEYSEYTPISYNEEDNINNNFSEYFGISAKNNVKNKEIIQKEREYIYELITKIADFEQMYKSIIKAIMCNKSFHVAVHDGFIISDGLPDMFDYRDKKGEIKAMKEVFNHLKLCENKEFSVQKTFCKNIYNIRFDNIFIETDLLTYFLISETGQERSYEYLEISDFLKELYEALTDPYHQMFIYTDFFIDKKITVDVRHRETETEVEQIIKAVSDDHYYVEKEVTFFEFKEDEDMKNALFSDNDPDSEYINVFIYDETVEQLTEFVEKLKKCVSDR